MTTDKLDNKLASIYSAGEDKLAQYNVWADTYEADLVNRLGYMAHIEAVSEFAQLLPERHTQVLDVACGTGLVGATLKALDYVNVDGADFSPDMLQIASERGVYQNTYIYDAIENRPVLKKYDALICVGLFGFGPPHLEHMVNILEALDSGGTCLVTVNGKAWQEKNLEFELTRQADKHQFDVREIKEIDYITKENIKGMLLHLVR